MKTEQLKSKYPHIWDTVEWTVRDEMQRALKSNHAIYKGFTVSQEAINVFAHNAAFMAASAHNTHMKEQCKACKTK